MHLVLNNVSGVRWRSRWDEWMEAAKEDASKAGGAQLVSSACLEARKGEGVNCQHQQLPYGPNSPPFQQKSHRSSSRVASIEGGVVVSLVLLPPAAGAEPS